MDLIELLIHGRTAEAGTWTSQGEGKCLEGGIAAGGQLVDLCICPHIGEGKLCYIMFVDECVGTINQKPKDDGLSDVAGTGSVHTFCRASGENFHEPHG